MIQVPDLIEVKFQRLVREWKSGRGPHSSTLKLVMHPTYQAIIGMGADAIPLILRELETKPDAWFWALRSITEANPVEEKDRGDCDAMARAWVEWGKQHGYF